MPDADTIQCRSFQVGDMRASLLLAVCIARNHLLKRLKVLAWEQAPFTCDIRLGLTDCRAKRIMSERTESAATGSVTVLRDQIIWDI
jgi:hypothetical protein